MTRCGVFVVVSLSSLAAGWQTANVNNGKRRCLLRRASEAEDEVCSVIRFVTGNQKKLNEVVAILDEFDIPLPLERIDLDLDELQSDVPEKIAAAKCSLAAKVTGGPVLVDDTSLGLEALGGMPGPYIKWFNDGDMLWRMLKGFESKRAYAQSCVAFSVGPGTVPLLFTGKVHGEIVAGGDQWDSCFRPDGFDVTFAEMDFDTKNQISHRAKAIRSMSSYIIEHKDILVRLCGENVAEPKLLRDATQFYST